MNTTQRPVARALAWLLGLANADPPSVYRREFYALKDRLLRRHGQRVGHDVQHIVRGCWGYEEEDGCQGPRCRRCGGTGIWDEAKVLLERWALGDRIFHRPDRRVWGPKWVPTITGRIQHDGVSHAAAHEAALWLALLFDPPLCWRLLRSSRRCGWQWRPLTALQVVVFEVWTRLRRLVPRRCFCGLRYVQNPFGRHHWCVCRQCRTAPTVDVELPF